MRLPFASFNLYTNLDLERTKNIMVEKLVKEGK